MAVYLLTWTTYGTWLPGDERGWKDKHQAGILQRPDPQREASARRRMNESILTLLSWQRNLVKQSFLNVSNHHNWMLHAYSVAANHVHLVLSFPDDLPAMKAIQSFKAYASRALNETAPKPRQYWWTRGGSARRLASPSAINSAIRYVENQSQ